MAFGSIVLLVVFSVLATPILTRPPTKCDIDKINTQIRTVKYKLLELQRYITYIESEQKRNRDEMKRIDIEAEKNTKWTVKRITDNQKWLNVRVANHFNWFYGQKNRNIAHEIDKTFRNFSGHVLTETRTLRHGDRTWSNTEIRTPLIQIMRSYPTEFKKQMSLATEFLKKVTSLQSKTFQDMKKVKDNLYLISRQVQLQQFNEFEKARSDGNSGIKQIRTSHVGAKNFHSNDHNGWSIAGIHDAEGSDRYVGIGEFVAVLNGIEFKTSQTNYKLEQPATKDKTLHKTEHISFPEVPDAVLQNLDPKSQIDEMREWFKAFQTQDVNIRKFQTFFKPVLSYLEGVWLTDTKNEQNSEQFKYTSYTGFKSSLPYLPTTIMGFDGKEKPIYSTWNYKILSHPLTNYLSTKKLKPLFDPVTQQRHNWRNTNNTATVKFDIEGLDVNGNRRKPGTERQQYYTFLDGLMEEIPGKDNYGASITANGFDAEIRSGHPRRNGKLLNGAYYHRPYKLATKDAMGVDTASRSYADRIYVALNTQAKVSGPTFNNNGKSITTKVSYAVPMEIIYTTPLAKWNPYNIPFVEDCSKVLGDGSKASPFSANCPNLYFHTPEAFFTNTEPTECSTKDSIDSFYFTSPDTSKPICMVGSGIRILLPKIHGIEGVVRQRYPIMPVNGEGSSIWKKLNAMEECAKLSGKVIAETLSYHTGESTNVHLPIHQHTIIITKADQEALLTGKVKFIKKATEPDRYHRHILTLRRKGSTQSIEVSGCDSGDGLNRLVCFDGHKDVMVLVK